MIGGSLELEKLEFNLVNKKQFTKKSFCLHQHLLISRAPLRLRANGGEHACGAPLRSLVASSRKQRMRLVGNRLGMGSMGYSRA
jgi:hypothetical protein